VRLSEPGQLPIWAGANVCTTPLSDHAPGVVSVNCDFSQLRLAATFAGCLFDWLAGDAGTFFAAGPGPNRFGRDQKPAKLKRDHVLTLLVVVFVAFRIAIGLPRVHYGWTPVESFAP
jgi:hypothetical protein